MELFKFTKLDYHQGSEQSKGNHPLIGDGELRSRMGSDDDERNGLTDHER
jgi:hypothetical protein